MCNSTSFIHYPSLRALLNTGGTEKLNHWTNAYNADADDIFFQRLWNSLDLTRDEARLRWQQQLFDFAHNHLKDAIKSTPFPSIRRYRAISAAESIFYKSAHKHLDKLFQNQEEKEEHDHATSL